MTWVNAVIQGILLGGLYAMFACGLSLLFGVMRIINLAHGDIGLLGAFMVYVVVQIVAVLLLSGLQLFLSHTKLGRAMRATADDWTTAELVGIDAKAVYGLASAIAIATAALAGVFFGTRSAFDPTLGPAQLIFAFEAVVMSGLGSLWGTLAGGIILGVAQGIGAQIDPSWSILAGHLVFLAVIAFRQGGIFAVQEARA